MKCNDSLNGVAGREDVKKPFVFERKGRRGAQCWNVRPSRLCAADRTVVIPGWKLGVIYLRKMTRKKCQMDIKLNRQGSFPEKGSRRRTSPQNFPSFIPMSSGNFGITESFRDRIGGRHRN
jgi:hypothetical protein